MNKLVKILFIGNFNKESDVKAFKLLNIKIYSITKFDTRYRKEKLPKRISKMSVKIKKALFLTHMKDLMELVDQ